MPGERSELLSQTRKLLPVCGLLLFAQCMTTQLTTKRPVLNAPGIKPVVTASPSSENFVRAEYPYSVVVGGVYTPEELSRARRTDRVVRDHYQNFGDRPQFRKISKDLLVYVSYRKRDQVYWTRTRHLVKRGETVLTDGVSSARARCGNQLSETPRMPVAKSEEPDEDVLATPEAPKPGAALPAMNNPEVAAADSYVPPSAFSDVPITAAPVKGGTIEIPVGAPNVANSSFGQFPTGNLMNLYATPRGQSRADVPAQTGPSPAAATNENAPAPGDGGNGAPGGGSTGSVPTFEVPFVPPRPPLAPVPEPNLTKTMWLILMGGLGCLAVRKSARR